MMTCSELRTLFEKVNDEAIYARYRIKWSHWEVIYSIPEDARISCLFQEMTSQLKATVIEKDSDYIESQNFLVMLKKRCRLLKDESDGFWRWALTHFFSKCNKEAEEVEKSWNALVDRITVVQLENDAQYNWVRTLLKRKNHFDDYYTKETENNISKELLLFEYACRNKHKKAKLLYDKMLTRQLSLDEAQRVFKAALTALKTEVLFLKTPYPGVSTPKIFAKVRCDYLFDDKLEVHGYAKAAVKKFADYLRTGVLEKVEQDHVFDLLELLIRYRCSDSAIQQMAGRCSNDEMTYHYNSGVLEGISTSETLWEKKFHPFIKTHLKTLSLKKPMRLDTEALQQFKGLSRLNWEAPQELDLETLRQLPNIDTLRINLKNCRNVKGTTEVKCFLHTKELQLVNACHDNRKLTAFFGSDSPYLETLNIVNFNLENRGLMQLIENQRFLHKLKITGINNHTFTTVESNLVKCLFKLTRLRSLELQSIYDMDPQSCLHYLSEAAPYLNQLTLHNCILSLESLINYLNKHQGMVLIFHSCVVQDCDNLADTLQKELNDVRVIIEGEKIEIYS